MRRLVLVGNGLSIAAKHGFGLQPLTTAIRGRLNAVDIGGRTAREHLEDIRDRLEADGQQDPHGSTFERLLGPLDRLGRLINVELAAVVGAVRPDLTDSLREVGNLVHELYIRGVGAVLSEIDALDTAANLDPVRAIVRWASGGLGNYDHLSVYTINYDPLLDRALLELETEVVGGAVRASYFLADEFSGLDVDTSVMTIAAGTNPVTAFAPRSEPYARLRAVDLVHLHGGQHWIRSSSGLVYKAPLASLRAADAYGRWTRGDPITMQPAVVLTDQKSAAVLQSPFLQAYDRLRHDMSEADRIAVLGYGFGDVPLNDVLSDALVKTRPTKRCLINRNACDPGDEDKVRAETAAALGVEVANLPEVLMRSLPQVAIERSGFFSP